MHNGLWYVLYCMRISLALVQVTILLHGLLLGVEAQIGKDVMVIYKLVAECDGI